MRKEFKMFRESIERKGSIERGRETNREKTYLPMHQGRKEKIRETKNSKMSQDASCGLLTSSQDDDGMVMRPPLRGRSTPIPNSSLQQKRVINNNDNNEGEKERIKENRKKPEIRILENIQIKPPRDETKRLDGMKEKADNKEDTDMEWEENGFDWNEEVEKENRAVEEGTQDIQKERNTQEETLMETHKGSKESWTVVTRKGKREDKKKKEKEAVANVRKKNR